MSMLDQVLNEMRVINEQAQNSEHRYTVLTVDTVKLDTLIRHHGDEANFCDTYGLTKLNRVKHNDNLTKIYIEKSDTQAHIQELIDDLSGAVIDEFYGLVQFDGDEPEAQGYYNSDYTNDPANPLSMNIVPTRKRKKQLKMRYEFPTDGIDKSETSSDKNSATKENESTEASDVAGTHISSVNIVKPVSDEAPALPRRQSKMRRKKSKMRVDN